ncbi:FAD-dependent oxidoreductase [uncultured Methylobacterium sp.]|uniref:NAD(P)/FAD-dependent oxidoreductase n=1 Tax=uncultured Methylobacterium sp. TaxID=157278 RepID=UPI002595C160|nr:FAD-dependent oxidoreductase [uncultured Methylobacterium sp.]
MSARHAASAGAPGRRGSRRIVEVGEAVADLDGSRKGPKLAPLPDLEGWDILGTREIGYDVLVLAVGSRANDVATTGMVEHRHLIDSRADADTFSRAARAEMLCSLAEDQEMGIAIVGGSATGVELVAELVHLLQSAATFSAGDMRARARLTRIESGPRRLAPIPETVSKAATRRPAVLGGEIRCNARVSEARADGFRLQGGGRVPAVLSELDGLGADRNHPLLVGPTLQKIGNPAAFALGDCASLMPHRGERPLPSTAQAAHQQA